MSGAIIAAGRGERLREAVAGLPKPLVELDGAPLLIRQIDAMRRLGIAPIHVIINTETARAMEQLSIAAPAQVELSVADTASSMESLLHLGERIAPGRFLLATVDAFIADAQWRSFFARALSLTDNNEKGGLDGALGVVRWRGDQRPLFAGVAADGSIDYLGDQPREWVTAGIYFFSTRIFAFAEEARRLRLDALRRYLGLLLEGGMRLGAAPVSEALDIDEAADLEEARRRLTSRVKVGASG